MEDRLTPGLYLELGNVDPSTYAAERALRLASCEGVDRVSWWENLAQGRTELPMEIEDGSLLGVAEVSEGFSAPEPLPGFVSHHFHRYARPGQGILTGRPTTGLLLVWISPASPARTQELRDWADFIHIRHIAAAALPGFTRTTVYENRAASDPQFMHFYELDTDDVEQAYGAMARLVARNLGGSRSAEFAHWADYKAAGGRLVYCNTFHILGEVRPHGTDVRSRRGVARSASGHVA